jgi:hypothetical protein
MNHLTKKILSAKGQFVGCLWQRPMKTYKGVDAVVTKTVRTTVQVGVDYDARESVQAARASGEAPAVNAGLPWGRWLPGHENYVIEHKGKHYVRLYPVRDAAGNPRSCKVVYRINGVRVAKHQLAGICLASEFAPGSDHGCYTLAEDNLQQVKFANAIFTRANAKAALISLSQAVVV